ncbi:MAG: metallophosphoesterase family protein [Acidimicrobiales bacterium]
MAEEPASEPPQSEEPTPRRWAPPLRRVVVVAAVAVLGGAANLATLGMTANVAGTVGPGTVEVGARAATSGTTVLDLPPLGRVTGATHGAPVRLRIRIDELDLEALAPVLARPRPERALRDEIEAGLPPLLRRLTARAAVAGLVVGGLVGAVVSHRRWWLAGAGAAGGVLVVAVVLGLTWRSFDPVAFDEARFEGALARAPAVLESLEDLDAVRGRLQALSQQVAGLYAATELDPVVGETLVLHVSDVHLNPLGLELVEQLARSFDVDAVLDTGDLTSFGNPLEARITDVLAGIGVPYLLVPGNHDSPANRAAIADSGVVTVLEDEVEEVAGVAILGVADPTFTADNLTSTAEATAIKRRRGPEVAALVRRERPDVLAVHDPVLAEEAVGSVPVVAAGHTHRRSLEERDGTVILTVGSTGATGLGSFLVESARGYQAEILRFDEDRLVAVDYVTLQGVDGDFQMERKVIAGPEPSVP